ncbi:hypothetical protein LCGC14_2212520 [marine sediment metagenome]|uniref:Uncharacterized protein n=1 Tax=marine sediment metagenome TaxID=412755 RepID=A0A0F9G910_9ZZZZ
MDRPLCQDRNFLTNEACWYPAKFVWERDNKLVCGIHARNYTADSLHPFRMRDWKIDKAIKLLKEKEAKDGR